MSDWEWLAGYSIHGVVTGLVLMSVYFVQSHLRMREERVRYAGMLLVELRRIYVATNPFTTHGFRQYWRGPLPNNVYNGLVNSTELSKFDSTLQMRLHDFYRDVALGKLGDLGDVVYQMYHDVRNFQRRNEWRRLSRVKIELSLILDPRRGVYAPDEYKMPGMWWLWFLTVPVIGVMMLWLMFGFVSEAHRTVTTSFVIVSATSWWLLFLMFAVMVNVMWKRIKKRDAKLARQLRAVFLYATTSSLVVVWVILFAGNI